MAKKTSADSQKGGTRATDALRKAGISFVAHAYEHDPNTSSFGLEAAEVLRIQPARVFKTLIAQAKMRMLCAIVPVDRQLDLKALAAAANEKSLSMARVEDAERATGYVAGGISPLGQKKKLDTYLDSSALLFATIYVSGGKRGFDVELAPQDLVALASASVVKLV